VSNIVEFNIIFLIEIRIVVYFFIWLISNLFRIRFRIFSGSSTNYDDPNRARTISSNVSISLTLVAFDIGAILEKSPLGCFTLIVLFTAFTLEVNLM